MSVRSDGMACTTSPKLLDTFQGEAVSVVLSTASATVYLGGSTTLTAGDGLVVIAPAAAPFAPVNLGVITGPLYVLGAAGGEAVSFIATK